MTQRLEAKNLLGLFFLFFAAHRERRIDQPVAGDDQPPRF